MKVNLFLPALLFSLISAFAVFAQSGDQSSSSKSEEFLKAERTIFEIARAKRLNSPFTLITPQDLVNLSAAELDALTSTTQDPCASTTTILPGMTVNGELTSSDCRLDDGSYADIYFFQGSQGQQVDLWMNSTAFDAYLGLLNEDGSFDIEDDNGGGGKNAKISVTLPASGYYFIIANSVLPDSFGTYQLSFNNGAPCTYSLDPSSANVPAAGGTFTFNVITQSGCQWSAYTTGNYFLRSSSAGTGSGTVTYEVDVSTSETVRTGYFIVGGQRFTVTQPPLVCSYSISPASASFPASGGSGSFTINAPDGCPWSASADAYFISTESYGRGTSVIHYTVATNNTTDRIGKITVNGLDHTITQPGLNCTFAVSTTNISVDRFDHTGTIAVDTQPGCEWSTTGGSFTTLQVPSRFGPGSINYRIYANNSGFSRSDVIGFYGIGIIRIFVSQSGSAINRTVSDFDGDGKADLAVYRPSNNYWYISHTNGDFNGIQLGGVNDRLSPADYDGDGKIDLAVYNGGNWSIIRSPNNQAYSVNFGAAEDIPVPADFDGDGKADISVYRPSNGVWYRINSSNNQFVANSWGAPGDKPAIGDFDGDGKADLAVYRPSNGVWYIVNSSNNQYTIIGFGAAEDLIVPADYDGDGKTDIAVYRPSTNIWYRLNSSNGAFAAAAWGAGGDKPVPADYDGDGKADIAVYRDGTWYIVRSSDGQFSVGYFGNASDVPLPNVYVR